MFQKNKRYRLMPPCHQEAAHVSLLQCSMTEPTGALRRLRRRLVDRGVLLAVLFRLHESSLQSGEVTPRFTVKKA